MLPLILYFSVLFAPHTAPPPTVAPQAVVAFVAAPVAAPKHAVEPAPTTTTTEAPAPPPPPVVTTTTTTTPDELSWQVAWFVICPGIPTRTETYSGNEATADSIYSQVDATYGQADTSEPGCTYGSVSQPERVLDSGAVAGS